MQFSALFSYMLWHIELKFCTWLCFDVLQIKFECRHFASIFEGVMPLGELRIKEMCSFPHFSPTCFDILSWNFATWLYFNVLQIQFECCHFVSIFEVCLFFNKNIGNTQFSAVFSCMLYLLSWNFATWLYFNVLQIQFECCHFVSIFEVVMHLLELRI